ncbi:hypothetical protein AB6A40_008579 [Gnathostoma spinigerum]|uniref:Uncharacterized protein n=1 Tax=Gnathostoma spinigerum TaxID=75299 RepID=A0ABD6EZT9_9BILA
MVDVVGLRDGEAVEVFRMSTYRDWLRKESDYCDTFFKTWSVTKRKRNPVVKFFAEADVLEIFIHFCQWKELPLDFDKECLVDSLIFADRYLCDNFFNILLEKWFRLPFLLRSVADWYSFARHLSNVKIYRFISQVTASLFPIMLETCLVEQLSDQEMAMVEAAYMDLPNIFSEPFSDGYENAKKTFTDANDEITKLENVFEMGCSLAETTYQKKQDSSKISPVSSCSDVFVLLSNVASILRELSDEEVLSICQYIRSSKTRSNMVPHRHVKKNSITKDDQTGVEPTTLPKNEVTDISVFGKLLSSGPTHPAYPQPSTVKHSISVEATLNNLAMSSPAADSEQTRSTFWSAINSVSSPCVSEEPSSRVPLESPSTVTRGTKPWGDVQRLQCSFMEILHEEQALKESSSQEGASPCHTPSKHLSWIMVKAISFMP